MQMMERWDLYDIQDQIALQQVSFRSEELGIHCAFDVKLGRGHDTIGVFQC